MHTLRIFWDKIWRDKNGNIVLFQAPNLPLLVWFGCTIIQRVVEHGFIHSVAVLVGTGALIIWAALEVLYGVTYLRRALGVLVLAATIASRFS